MGYGRHPNTHTTLTNVSRAVNTKVVLDARGNAKGQQQESG